MAFTLLLAASAHVSVQAAPITVQARLVLGTSKEQKDEMHDKVKTCLDLTAKKLGVR